jgi:hypothetical protein
MSAFFRTASSRHAVGGGSAAASAGRVTVFALEALVGIRDEVRLPHRVMPTRSPRHRREGPSRVEGVI